MHTCDVSQSLDQGRVGMGVEVKGVMVCLYKGYVTKPSLNKIFDHKELTFALKTHTAHMYTRN